MSPVRSGLTFALVGTLAARVGAARTTGVVGVLAEQSPIPLRDGVRTGLVAGLVLLAAGGRSGRVRGRDRGGDAAD